MTTYPTLFNKNDFIKFLKKINISDDLIENFDKLPNFVKKDGVKYELNTMLTYNSGDETSYGFELNYYSKKQMEFIFNYKIFDDFEDSINYMICELLRYGYIDSNDFLCQK